MINLINQSIFDFLCAAAGSNMSEAPYVQLNFALLYVTTIENLSNFKF